MAFALVGVVAISGAQAADDWNGTLAATSRYVFRGVMQRGDAPGLQLDVHRAFDDGAFLGVWVASGPNRAGAYGRTDRAPATTAPAAARALIRALLAPFA